MKKPLIGVAPLWDETKDSIWMLPEYMNEIEKAGGVPVILPLTTDNDIIATLAAALDGFLFTGGHDVSPEQYGEKPIERCGVICGVRDGLEQKLFQKAVVEFDKPVLGICRGLQAINVFAGGTLYQDLPTQHPSAVMHQQGAPYGVPVHSVSVVEGTPLFDLLKKRSLPVNSCHHQAIRVLSDGLKPMAMSDDGLIEAVYMPGKRYVFAVQWHPELMGDTDESAAIFRSFVQACR